VKKYKKTFEVMQRKLIIEVFRPPGPLARKETKFLFNRNVSRSPTSVANCCGE